MKRILVPLLTAGLLSAGVLVTVATNANAVTCGVLAGLPTKSGNIAYGYGTRSNCGNSVTATIKLVVHSSPFNQDLVVTSYSGVTNGTRKAAWTRASSTSSQGWNFFSVIQATDGSSSTSAFRMLWP